MELHKRGHKSKDLKFKRRDQYRTFTYNQTGFKIKGGFLHLSKIGRIKIILHRQIPLNSKIKQVIVTRSKSGKWHACLTCEIESILPEFKPRRTVGIDLGIKNFAYDGKSVPNQSPLKKMLKSVSRGNRRISRKKKGSKNRKKAVRFYQLVSERIRNRRKDALHKISTRYSKKYNVVFMERLQKLNMVKNHKLARNIFDSGWSIFTRMISYKTTLVEVPPEGTTVECCRCGNSVPKSLAVRIHRCNICNLVIDRDYNASINILKRGLEMLKTVPKIDSMLPQELREVTLVEIPKVSRKQEKAVKCVHSGSLKDARKNVGKKKWT